ncbi:MAG: hypothetical protein PHR28_03835 [candidate division Zixibacteria bacterium]|nr:hypothetical protein [candidate division Zixibacteria bacterium]
MSSPVNLPGILVRVTFIGLVMNVIVPTTLLVVMALLRGNIFDTSGFSFAEQPENRMFFIILLVMGVADLALAAFIRKRPPRSVIGLADLPAEEQFEKSAMSLSWAIYSLNLSCTFYGLVLVVIGMRIEVMMLFVAMTLIGFELFRPRLKSLEMLWDRLESERSGRRDGSFGS